MVATGRRRRPRHDRGRPGAPVRAGHLGERPDQRHGSLPRDRRTAGQRPGRPGRHRRAGRAGDLQLPRHRRGDRSAGGRHQRAGAPCTGRSHPPGGCRSTRVRHRELRLRTDPRVRAIRRLRGRVGAGEPGGALPAGGGAHRRR